MNTAHAFVLYMCSLLLNLVLGRLGKLGSCHLYVKTDLRT